MKLIDKIEKMGIQAKSPEENYRVMGAERDEHQKRMLGFIRERMARERGERNENTLA